MEERWELRESLALVKVLTGPCRALGAADAVMIVTDWARGKSVAPRGGRRLVGGVSPGEGLGEDGWEG